MGADKISLEFNGKRLSGAVHASVEAFETCVLLLHGGPEGSKDGPADLFVKLGDALAVEGIKAVRFDFLGEGESEGDYIDESPSSQVAQYRHIVDWLGVQGCRRLGVVGESFGGTCALGGYDQRVNALVLLWPCIWLLDESFAPFLAPGRMSELAERGWFLEGERQVGQRFVDEVIADDTREPQLRNVNVPTLLIHGDADKEVPVHQSETAYAVLPEPKRLIIAPGGAHCLREEHEQPMVITETVAWMTEHLRDSRV